MSESISICHHISDDDDIEISIKLFDEDGCEFTRLKIGESSIFISDSQLKRLEKEIKKYRKEFKKRK